MLKQQIIYMLIGNTIAGITQVKCRQVSEDRAPFRCEAVWFLVSEADQLAEDLVILNTGYDCLAQASLQILIAGGFLCDKPWCLQRFWHVGALCWHLRVGTMPSHKI
jgi:hypothetical protein